MERDPFEGIDRDARVDALLDDPRLVIEDGVVWCVACNERIVPLAAVGHAEDALRTHLEVRAPASRNGETAQHGKRTLREED